MSVHIDGEPITEDVVYALAIYRDGELVLSVTPDGLVWHDLDLTHAELLLLVMTSYRQRHGDPEQRVIDALEKAVAKGKT